jgi:hypothetical protein
MTSAWVETSSPTQNRLPDASMNLANFTRNAAVNVSGPGHVFARADVGEKKPTASTLASSSNQAHGRGCARTNESGKSLVPVSAE